MDADFRGWLGPYLLDALVEQARARGIRNIQADVLLTNQRMLAVLRDRGLVVLDHFDSPSTVRVAIGAAQATPGWPGPHDRPRLLVELPGGQRRPAPELAAQGFQVVACPGPRRGGPRCQALAGRPCPLAAGADVIVTAYGSGQSEMSKLPDAHRRLHPTVPVCVTLAPGQDGPPGFEHLPAGEGAVVAGFLQRLITGPWTRRDPPDAMGRGGS